MYSGRSGFEGFGILLSNRLGIEELTEPRLILTTDRMSNFYT